MDLGGQRLQFLHGVSRKVQSAGLTLHIQQFLAGKLRNIRQACRGRRAVLDELCEQVDLPLQSALLGAGFGIQHRFIHRQKLGAVGPQAVKGAAANEVFQHPLVQVVAAHAAAEIVKIAEGAVGPALLHQLFYKAHAHVFH